MEKNLHLEKENNFLVYHSEVIFLSHSFHRKMENHGLTPPPIETIEDPLHHPASPSLSLSLSLWDIKTSIIIFSWSLTMPNLNNILKS